MLVFQHAYEYLHRRRAPLDSAVDQATRDALEEGDWLTIRSDNAYFEPVAQETAVSRVAYPIACDPQQPDSLAAGLTVVLGAFSAQTDRFAIDPTFAAWAGVGAARTAAAPAYTAVGDPLVAIGFHPAATDTGSAPLVYGLSTPLTAGGEDAFVVAYLERLPDDNNGLLQFVVF